MSPNGVLRALSGGGEGRAGRDLATLPIQHCWPGDVAPLITWGLVVTRGPNKARQNLGIYRQQVLRTEQGHHALAGPPRRRAGFSRTSKATPANLSRWRWCSAAIRRPFWGGDAGADLALRNTSCGPVAVRQDRAGQASRLRPASAGVGRNRAGRRDPSGEKPPSRKPPTATTPATTTSRPFPVFTIERITSRRDPIYHSTYTGKPPDEPAMLGVGAQRGLRAAPAEAVHRDRRFLPAARRLLIPAGGGQHRNSTPATPSG